MSNYEGLICCCFICCDVYENIEIYAKLKYWIMVLFSMGISPYTFTYVVIIMIASLTSYQRFTPFHPCCIKTLHKVLNNIQITSINTCKLAKTFACSPKQNIIIYKSIQIWDMHKINFKRVRHFIERAYM